MRTKTFITALTTTALLVSSTAMAASLSGSSIYTTVNSSVPAYQNYTVSAPRNVCRDVEVPVYGERERSSGVGGILGTIIGGVAGGLLGSQIGGGRGNTAATAAGAVGGALLGNHLGNQGSQSGNGNIVGYRREQRCKTEYVNEPRSRLVGYDVTVTLDGQLKTFRVTRDYRVGEKVTVNVTYTLN